MRVQGGPMTITPDQPTELELLRRLMTKNPSTAAESELVDMGGSS